MEIFELTFKEENHSVDFKEALLFSINDKENNKKIAEIYYDEEDNSFYLDNKLTKDDNTVMILTDSDDYNKSYLCDFIKQYEENLNQETDKDLIEKINKIRFYQLTNPTDRLWLLKPSIAHSKKYDETNIDDIINPTILLLKNTGDISFYESMFMFTEDILKKIFKEL